MKNYWHFVGEMRKSILGSDFIILLTAIFAAVFYVLLLSVIKEINKSFDKFNHSWAKNMRRKLNFFDNMVTTLTTIFPLLGMLGTVVSLLNLDLAKSGAQLEGIRDNFFTALTSTAWGIVFAVVFKFLYAVISTDIEETAESLDILVKRIKQKEAESDPKKLAAGKKQTIKKVERKTDEK